MKSILLQLYNGDLAPIEDYQPQLEEYKKKLEESKQRECDFAAKLSEPLRAEFEQIIADYIELIPLEISDVFIRGFKTGVRLMGESIYSGTKDGDDIF